MSSNDTLRLSEVRAQAATALAPAAGDELTVHIDYPDAIQPPTLILLWDDPWLEPEPLTMGYCQWTAHLLVWALAGRVEPGPGVDKLEQLVTYTIDRMEADPHQWPAVTVQAPRSWTIANIPLLGARLAYRVPVSVEPVAALPFTAL